MLNILRTFQLGFHRFSVCIYVPCGIDETATRAPPQLHKTPQHERKLQPRSDTTARRTLALQRGTWQAAEPRLRSCRGPRRHYHKSPNGVTLQLCTPKQELEQVFHPPLLAANYIYANISGVLLC